MSDYTKLSQVFGSAFDTNSVEAQQDYDVLPPGKYPVLIESAEIKQTKDGKGHYLMLAMSIIEGPARNRKLWDNINIDNPSSECVKIALSHLAQLGKVLGIMVIDDLTELTNRTVIVNVKVDKERNVIRSYSPLSEPPSAVGINPVTVAAPQAAQPAAACKPPWMR